MNPEIIPFGEQALLIRFPQDINPDIHESVIFLDQQIRAAQWSGLRFQSLAYASIHIGFDPFMVSFSSLKKKIESFFPLKPASQLASYQDFLIPVCYEASYALDQDSLSRQSGLSWNEIILTHTETSYRVYMLGFLPGFAYLGKNPAGLHCQRKPQPRQKVPGQSVAIAGAQSGIYPFDAPGGWQILGRSPMRPFDPRRKDPFLFSSGDRVRFVSISQADYTRVEKSVDAEPDYRFHG
ncbi:MAG: allophanate hydrolase subunit 1 [Bacteroidota bacterium]